MLNSYYQHMRVDSNYANILASHTAYQRPYAELFEIPILLDSISNHDIQTVFKTIFQTRKSLTADLSP